MQELIQYIKHNKVNAATLAAETSDEKNNPLPKRFIYTSLQKHARDFFRKGTHPKMIALSGLRGVGKTTLMWQTAQYVYNNIHKHIYFISADTLKLMGFNLYQAIRTLEEHILKKPLNQPEHQLMLLIDEVHDAENWDKTLKYLYDRSKGIFTLVTGSSALLLHQSPDLASRCSFLKVYPFSFPEFILSKSWIELGKDRALLPVGGLSDALRQMIFYSEDYEQLKESVKAKEQVITEYFQKTEELPLRSLTRASSSLETLREEYISYHNIARFLSIFNKGMIIHRIISLFDRIITKDIPDLDPEEAGLLHRILLRLAASNQLNFQTLAKEFRIKEKKVENFIQTLAQAEVLNLFYPHAGLRSKTGMNRKAFFMSPSLRKALYERMYGHVTTPDLRAKLYEDIVAMHLRRNLDSALLSYGIGYTKNPDFIIETMGKPILLEVGINKTDTRQITNYDTQAYRYGLIINAKIKKPRYNDKRQAISLPLHWFLLL